GHGLADPHPLLAWEPRSLRPRLGRRYAFVRPPHRVGPEARRRAQRPSDVVRELRVHEEDADHERSPPRLEKATRAYPLLVVVAVEVDLLHRPVVRPRRLEADAREQERVRE